ncbi:MAG: putative sensor domain DACNV-containing protein [Smithella sp.]
MKDFSMPQTHSYPHELVSFIFDLWQDVKFLERERIGIDFSFQLPDRSLFEQIVSVCYQASLMREETRPVMFRLIIRPSELFPVDMDPPAGLHILKFSEPRSFNEQELYRLAPAANFYRTLIGISIDQEEKPRIWGLIHSGLRWMTTIYGGRKISPALPSSLVIYVTGPGKISVCLGSKMIASLNGGQINPLAPNIFAAERLKESFAEEHYKLRLLHSQARDQSKRPWAVIDPEFSKSLVQQIFRRIIGVIRASRHGGMLIYVPIDMSQELSVENSFINIKYRFHADEPRHRFATLMLRIMNTFAKIYGDINDPEKVIGWHEYVTCQNEEIALLDEAIFNVAQFIATLAATDGAVVMTKQQELLGFGGFVLGDNEKIGIVHRVIDLDCKRTKPELTNMVGTRHQGAYRLCQHLHDALAVVISQDGDVELVKWLDGAVTCWSYAPSGVPDF